MIDAAAGTVVLFSDIGCPWAHAAVYRFRRARSHLGLDGRVPLDHRAFPLELVNRRPTPKRILDAEIPVTGSLAPDAGWRMWQAQAYEFPVTTLLALEAVQAAKLQSRFASEALDRALRVAFFGHSRTISMHHEVLAVAESAEGVHAGQLREVLETGQCRATIFDDLREAERSGVKGSPHFFLAGGTEVHNPGVSMHWEGDEGEGFPVVDADDPAAFERLVREAAGVDERKAG